MTNSTPPKFSIGFAFAFLLAVPVLFGVALYVGNQETTAAPARQLDIIVRASATGLVVTNVQTSAWSELVVYINGLPPEGYKATLTAPVPGESVTIPLSQCINAAGLRFSPLEHAVRFAWVGGGGFAFTRYDITR